MIEDHLGEPSRRYHPYKSRGEYRIAGLLDRYGLPFLYEKPTAVVDRGSVRLWYPDFTLTYGPIIEYFGIVGDDSYAGRTKHKLEVYQQNQMTALPLYPHDLTGQWEGRLLRRVDRALESSLSHYRSLVRF